MATPRSSQKTLGEPEVAARVGISRLGHVGPTSGAGTEFLTVSEFDGVDVTNYYYGGVKSNGIAWKVNRYNKTTFAKTSADKISNPIKTTLALAWTDRLTLTYS